MEITILLNAVVLYAALFYLIGAVQVIYVIILGHGLPIKINPTIL
jgi:hypothetical protein